MTSRKRTTKKRASKNRNVPAHAKHVENLFALSSDWYWEQDSEYRFTAFVGDSLEKLDIEPRRLLGTRRWDGNGTPLDNGGSWEAHKKVLRAHKSFSNFVYRYTDKNGKLHFLNVSGEPIFDKRKRFKGYRGIGKDITEQVQVERRMAIEHASTRILAESPSIRDASLRIIRMVCETLDWACGTRWEVAPDGNMLRCVDTWGVESPAVTEFLEATAGLQLPKEPIGLARNVWLKGEPMWVPDVSKDPAFIQLSLAPKAGLHGACAFPIKTEGRVTGVIEFFSANIHRPDAELFNCAIYVGIQMGQFSERLHAQEQLRESEERFRSLTGLSSDWYWEQDADLRFTRFTNSFERTTGNTNHTMIGEQRWDRPRVNLTDEDWARHKAQLERHEPFYDFEMCRIGQDGLEYWGLVSGLPIFDAEGRFTGYRGIGRDITARKRAEKAMRESEARFRDLTELSSDWYWEQDDQFRFTSFFGVREAKNGYDAFSLVGKRRWDKPRANLTEEDWVRHKAQLERHEPFYDFEICDASPDGSRKWASISGTPFFDGTGKFMGYRGVGRDITERKNREEALLHFRAAIDATVDGIHILDYETMKFIDVNKSAGQHLGYTREEFLKLPIGDISPGYDKEKLRKMYDRLFTGEDVEQRAEIVHRHRNGRLIPIEIHRRGVVIDGRRIIVNVVHDITDRKRAEAVLRESEERFRSLTELSSDWYWQQDEQFRFVQMSGSVLQKIGLRDNEYAGKAPWDPFFRIDLDSSAWGAHRAVLEAREPFRDFICRWTLPDGGSVYYSMSGEPHYDDNGAFIGYRGIGRDVTERTLAQERIAYLATHDALTGLPNRAMFTEMLGNAIATARRYQRQFALFFLDLDRFKNINDTFGHEVGDLLLKEMSKRLSDTLRDSDVVARLGGDEFVVLLQEIGDQNNVAAVARKLLMALIKPVVLLGQECRVTASIGICMFPGDAQDEQSLMKNADIAMYRAKEEGKNNYQFYSEHINVHTLERLALESNLRLAIERQEFSLHYQAKVDLKTNRIVGVEALLRWQHPELGMVSPAQFIPLAEETGLIIPIGKWVLKTACAQNIAWQREGLIPLCMAVNLSPRQFSDDELLDDIARTLQSSNMDAGLLELELTEGMVMQSPERAAKVLADIKSLGVRLAIDDFGVGYSSLAQIKRFPIDTIKIDRSFIRDIPQDAEDNAITETIIAMGKTLSLTVVAEGVETPEQLKFLRERGCDQMQGYYFNKPMAAGEFAGLVRQHMNGQPAKWGTGR